MYSLTRQSNLTIAEGSIYKIDNYKGIYHYIILRVLDAFKVVFNRFVSHGVTVMAHKSKMTFERWKEGYYVAAV